jgi:signal transduction histidine kinase
MLRFQDLSIGQKLQRAGMAASLTALLPAAAAFVWYDIHTYRDLMVRRVVTDAQIVGVGCISPLLFDDAETASSTLAGLRAEPQIEAAGVFTRKGRLLASYEREKGAAARLTGQGPPGPQFAGGALVVAHPVSFDGEQIGSVAIRAGMGEIQQRVVRYFGITALVLAGSLAASIMISRRAHRAIAAPILHLADTASAVSERKDYAVRAVSDSHDEIGTLVRTFNEMLGQIQEQDEELRQSRTLLERRVEERTRELETRSQELATANQELEAFSYSVSHDLRAPLRGIDGFSRALLDDYDGKVLDEQGAHYLKRVRANTQRMAELIDDLLHLSRVTRADLVRAKVDFTRLACKVSADLAAREPERHVDFRIAEGLVAYVDAHLLAIVLENLLGNAWKFTARRPDARIEVGRETDGSEHPFFVRDNGAGFDMAYAGKLFGVFQRLHEAASFEGTGIGLATVQRIIHRHGGRIWAESAPDRGATFFFTLGGEA